LQHLVSAIQEFVSNKGEILYLSDVAVFDTRVWRRLRTDLISWREAHPERCLVAIDPDLKTTHLQIRFRGDLSQAKQRAVVVNVSRYPHRVLSNRVELSIVPITDVSKTIDHILSIDTSMVDSTDPSHFLREAVRHLGSVNDLKTEPEDLEMMPDSLIEWFDLIFDRKFGTETTTK
jgi:hypothetical protein